MTETITISFDPGTSGSKILASYPSRRTSKFNSESYYLAHPSINELTEETYSNFLENVEKNIGLNDSLVSYKDLTGNKRYWEVGESASNLGYLSINERKFEKALVKILAFLGFLVKSFDIDIRRTKLNLLILLPFTELYDRKELGDALRGVLTETGFFVNNNFFERIEINELQIKPEGFGIYQSCKEAKVGVLLIGHRDLTWLSYNRGKLSRNSNTFSGKGMHEFLRRLSFSPGEEIVTARIIAEAGESLDESKLISLTQTKKPSELKRLKTAIANARKQYLLDLVSTIKNLNFGSVDKIYISGGTAQYFLKELNNVFKEQCDVPIDWNKALNKEFQEVFEIKKKERLIIPLFSDCFGFFNSVSQPKVVVPSLEQSALVEQSTLAKIVNVTKAS